MGGGAGYFTAIMAEVTGPSGQVVACEVDAGLAVRAKHLLSRYPNIIVYAANGIELDPGPCDAMLINAGITIPPPGWLDRLSEGGRMALTISMARATPTVGKGTVAWKSAASAGRNGDRSPTVAAPIGFF